jgi:branched-subunit amino acid aminotransferase/4-amino-4-deoxychorismate lyase
MSSDASLAFLNGRLLPQTEASLPLNDAGFVLGATITDLCRTFRHRLFRWSAHLERFRRSCEAAFLPPPLTDAEITTHAEELVARNAQRLRPEDDLALVLFATPGPIGYYLGQPGSAGEAAPTFGMHTFPLPLRRYIPLFREGARLVIPNVRHVPAACVDPRIKQRSRLFWWLAQQEAHRVDPGATALLLDTEDHVTETAAANFLVVQSGVVVSPPRHSILGGISLQVVQELCYQLGVRFEERPLSVADCLTAEEAMLTSTPFCVAGVSRINNSALPWPGKIFLRILQAWTQMLGFDIRGQIERS